MCSPPAPGGQQREQLFSHSDPITGCVSGLAYAATHGSEEGEVLGFIIHLRVAGAARHHATCHSRIIGYYPALNEEA